MDTKTLLEDYIKILDKYEKAFEDIITIIYEKEKNDGVTGYVSFFYSEKHDDCLPTPHIEILDGQVVEICKRLEKFYTLKDCIKTLKNL